MIGIEAAEKDLLGLPPAGVLRDDQARRQPEQLLRGFSRPELDIELADCPG